MSSQDSLPQLYGAIVLVFSHRQFRSSIIELLPANTKIDNYADCIEIVYGEAPLVYSWEIDDLLTQLFKNCDLELLCDLVENYNASVLIDISFRHFERFPALIFEGHNMQIIHMLHADISIDPY